MAGEDAKKFIDVQGPIIKEKSKPFFDKMVKDYDKVGMWCNMGEHTKSGEPGNWKEIRE